MSLQREHTVCTVFIVIRLVLINAAKINSIPTFSLKLKTFHWKPSILCDDVQNNIVIYSIVFKYIIISIQCLREPASFQLHTKVSKLLRGPLKFYLQKQKCKLVFVVWKEGICTLLWCTFVADQENNLLFDCWYMHGSMRM